MTLCTNEAPVPAVAQPWSASGAPLCETTLRETVAVLKRAWAVLGSHTADDPALAAGDFATLDHALEETLLAVRQRLRCAAGQACSAHADLVEPLVALSEVQTRLRKAQSEHCAIASTRAQEALRDLGMLDTVEKLIDRVPKDVGRLGFDRALISKVHESTLTAQACHVAGDLLAAEQMLQAASTEPLYLTHAVLETEMVRRGKPMLLPKSGRDSHRGKPLLAAMLPHSYVAAPIITEGKVIGFLHADRYLQRRHVNEVDRDLLWSFAQGLGHVFQRVTLAQRQRLLRQEIDRLTTETTNRLYGLFNAEVSVDRLDEAAQQEPRPHSLVPSLTDGALTGSGLTRRELEVIRLMAAGETNAAIGRHLTISEGTTKSHVKRILRKLGAANRAEAVSMCVRMQGFGG